MIILKRVILIIIISLCINYIFPSTAVADVGPKPSIKVIVENPPEGKYYLDLLIDYEISHSYVNVAEEDVDDINMFTILKNYNLGGWRPALATGTKIPLFGKLTGEKENDNMVHSFSYLGVPDRFKVIVVEETGDVIVSENIIERKAFESKVYFDYDSKILRESSIVPAYLKQFLITFPTTLMVEGLILLIFAFSLNRNWKSFVLINLMTQVLLTATVFTGMYFQGSMAAFFYYIPVEVIILVVESKLFKKYLKGHSQSRKFAFALVANILSFLMGIIELIYIPY